ncbi:MAG: hypothetical protein CFH41_01670 [Alphaproteobacteria bacterium MarineAlpha11_Bin1]|nr:MAG: hypothetical protein CFH41_01670 [Alphaproteobacteria bacterium MarineAlpha11_Bin1]|tara:strand:+ start:5044 stop:5334 length:291 start_codon:yes stop_codon:yes gene_type:complete
MFRRLGPEENIIKDIARVERMIRDRFGIPHSAIILVSEDLGFKPGFPRKETNAVFWKHDTRYRLKVFSPIAEVIADDLPMTWLLPSLEDTGELDCC